MNSSERISALLNVVKNGEENKDYDLVHALKERAVAPTHVDLDCIPIELDLYNIYAVFIWSIIEVADPELAEHCLHDAYLAYLFGKKLGEDKSALRIRIATALIHDFGKLDDFIHEVSMLSRGLDEEEWELMSDHPTRTYQMALEEVERLKFLVDKDDPELLELISCLPSAKHHHEQWRGGGYPSHLIGEEIPEPAQELAIADSYLGLREDRKYRKSISITETFGVLDVLSKAGYFRPGLLDIFKEMIEEQLANPTTAPYV